MAEYENTVTTKVELDATQAQQEIIKMNAVASDSTKKYEERIAAKNKQAEISAALSKKNIEALQAEIKKLEEAGASNEKIEAVKKRLNSAYISESRDKANNEKILAKLDADRLKAIQAEELEVTKSLGLRNQLLQKNQELRAERDKLGDISREFTKAELKQLKEINDQIDANNKRLESTKDILAKQKIGIGRYKEAFTSAIAKVGAIGAAVGVAIAALSGLVDAFKSSGKGAEQFAKISGNLSGAFTVLKGSFGNFASSLVSGDFKGALAAFEGFFGKVSNAAKAQSELNVLRLTNSKINTELSVTIAKLANDEAKLQFILDDDTRTFKERLSVIGKLTETRKRISDEELRIAKNNLDEAQSAYDLAVKAGNNGIEEAKNLASAQIEYNNKVTESELKVMEQRQKARQAELDLFEQQLDFNLDIFDKNKFLIEKQLESERVSVWEKIKLYDKLRLGVENNYKQNIDLINKQLTTKLDAAELEKITDEQELLRILHNAGAVERVANRAREVIMENMTFKQDIMDASSALATDAAEKELEEAYEFEQEMLRQIRESAEEEKRIAQETADKIREIDDRTLSAEIEMGQIQLEHLRRKGEETLQLELELLNKRKAQELSAVDLLSSERAAIIAKYELEELKIKEASTEQKGKLDEQSLEFTKQALTAIFGDNKAIAVAIAGIDMLRGIMKGVALGFPAMIPAIAASTATGYVTIKKILSTKPPSGISDKSAGSSIPTPPTIPQTPASQVSSLTDISANNQARLQISNATLTTSAQSLAALNSQVNKPNQIVFSESSYKQFQSQVQFKESKTTF